MRAMPLIPALLGLGLAGCVQYPDGTWGPWPPPPGPVTAAPVPPPVAAQPPVAAAPYYGSYYSPYYGPAYYSPPVSVGLGVTVPIGGYWGWRGYGYRPWGWGYRPSYGGWHGGWRRW